MKKIACIVGARPQFVKHFPLELALRKAFLVHTIHTGQHYDDNMSKVFFDDLGISKPSSHFHLTKSSHGGQTAEMLEQIEQVLLQENIDILLVYGDTNSTIAGALAAAKLNIPIVHVEAGLRSFNRHMPEEVNRVLTDHISELLFCSSEVGRENLKREGISAGVNTCGDLMKDALQILVPRLKQQLEKPYGIATFHRPYNTDDYQRLTTILDMLEQHPLHIVFPVHPRTKSVLNKHNYDFDRHSSVEFINPIGYIEMLSYQKYSDLVITDSGGIQKEAYWLKKKCITVRSETEWIETLNGQWNTLVFDNLNEIIDNKEPDEKTFDDGLYGDGKASERIVNVIADHFN